MKRKQTDKPEKLTYEQIQTISLAVAQDLSQFESTAGYLIVLMRDIAEHPFDSSHVETIATLLSSHLFNWATVESSEALRNFTANARQKVLQGITESRASN